MATTPNIPAKVPTKASGDFLLKEFHGLPVWTWGIAGVGGIGLGYYFYNKSKTAQANAANLAAAQAASTSPAVNPADVSGLGNYQAAGPYAGGFNSQPATINIGTPSTPSNWLTSIILTTSHAVNEYATSGTPGGLPDSVIATIPAGSTVQATGPEIVGAWNIPNGSELWYPVTYQGIPGFVSAYDVVNANTQIGNSPVPPPPVAPPIQIKTRKNTGTPYDKSYGSKAGGVPGPGPIGKAGYGIVPYDTPVTVTSLNPDSSGHLSVTYNGKTGPMEIWDLNTSGK